MSLESDALGYFMPNTILDKIFSRFLTFRDVCRFDTACCNQYRRPIFLDCISSESCIWFGHINRDLSFSAISWLKNRSVKIRHLKCSQITDEIAEMIGGFGSCLHWLDIFDRMAKYEVNDSITDLGICKLVDGCPNLINLDISFLATDMSIMRIASTCPNLETLNLEGCMEMTDISIIKLAQSCPNLCSLNLTGCCELTDESIIILCLFRHNISILDLSECILLTDHSIMMLTETCSDLTILSLRDCDEISDESIIRYRQNQYSSVSMLRICKLARIIMLVQIF